MTTNPLLSAVLADPHSDARYVLSDQVAEGNVTIPTLDLPAGVEVVLRDGLPDEVRCTMVQWVGTDECRSCSSFSRSLGIPAIDFCLTCHGTGRTPGIAKAVCEAWPVTRVVISDVRWQHFPSLVGRGYWRLHRQSWTNGDGIAIGEVPDVVFEHLRLVVPLHEFGGGTVIDGKVRDEILWNSPDAALAALAALSQAAVNYGRRLAGLPEIQFTQPTSPPH